MAGRPHGSLSPWPRTGATAEARAEGSSAGSAPARAGELAPLGRGHHRGAPGRAAAGSEVASACGLQAGAAPGNERVGGVRAPVQAARPTAGLDTRLAPAEPRRAALTPARGRGTRPLRADATRVEAIDHGRKAQRVDG